MENKNIESLGFIVKKETLCLLESEFKFQELVLEDLDPFPGFYDHFHIPLNEHEKKPRSIFALIKTMSFEQMDDFIRITSSIKKKFDQKFDAVMGRLTFQNSLETCIRIYMDNYLFLPQLIEFYKNNGIEFLQNRTIKPYSSLINIRKYMILEQIVPSIFRDLELQDTYYFIVENYVEWNKFEAITISIRNNTDHKVFDAAQAGIYNRAGVLELVRIYDPKSTLDHLIYLKQKYDLEISRSLYQVA